MCIRDRFAFFIHANNRELLVITFGIQIQEPIHPFPVFFGDRCDTPHLPQPRLTFVFFSISRIVSRLIVPKPSFLPKVSAKSSNVHLALPWGASLQACLLYTSPSPRDRTRSRMPSSA